MARRPVKIKKYSNAGARYRRRSPLVGILLFLLAAAVIFGIGWFGASHCIDTVTSFWYRHFSTRPGPDSSDSLAESQSASQSQSVSASDSSAPEQLPPPPPAEDETGVWGEVALSALENEDTLRPALQALVDAGADHAVVTLKDDRGYIYYDSAVELAATAGAVRSNADVALFARLCGEYGLTPAARLYAFRDPLAAYGDRTAAVQFQREGVLWLDTSQELGGKPWLNPYSLTARQYLLDLSAELDAVGIDDVVFAAVQFPSGYALDFCYYGEGADAITRTACLRECVALLQSTLDAAGQRAWFEWPTAAALGQGDPLVWGEEGAGSYGALRILLTPSTWRNAEGLQQLPACDAPALAAFAETAAQNGALRLGISTKELAADPALAEEWRKAAEEAGFTHFRG